MFSLFTFRVGESDYFLWEPAIWACFFCVHFRLSCCCPAWKRWNEAWSTTAHSACPLLRLLLLLFHMGNRHAPNRHHIPEDGPIPDIVGDHFKVGNKLGSGSFGVLYEGNDETLFVIARHALWQRTAVRYQYGDRRASCNKVWIMPRTYTTASWGADHIFHAREYA